MINFYLDGSSKDRAKYQNKIRFQLKKAVKEAKYKNVERKIIIK